MSGWSVKNFVSNPAGGGFVGNPLSEGTSVADLIPGIGDARAQDKANKQNIQQADINRRFQERMSNTAYQRAMVDMRKAGLNPTLAFMQGGASAPSGGAATVQASSKTRLADFALQSATGIGSMMQKGTALEQQQTLNDSTVKLNASATAKNVADAQRSQAETKGLGRKAAEGDLWNRFYKGINNVLDSSSKDSAKRSQAPLIKKMGPSSDKEGSSMFKWLTKKRANE